MRSPCFAIALAVVLSSSGAMAGKPGVALRRRLEEAAAKVLGAVLSPVTRRAQAGAHVDHLLEAKGALAGRPERPIRRWERDPILHRLVSAARGLHLERNRRLVAELTLELEEKVGRIEVPPAIRSSGQGLFYRAERAAALALLDRKASEMNGTFVHAPPTWIRRPGREPVFVGARDIYLETWKAVEPTRGVIRLGPGYQELGPAFYVLIDALNRQGIEVQVMDQQWAGYTSGDAGPGQVDSKEGIARDGAIVDGVVQARAKAAGLPFASVGQSMGGGPGLILAHQLVNEGVLSGVLSGPGEKRIEAPTGAPPLVALAPYLGYTPNVENQAFALFGRYVALLRAVPLPMLSRPIFNHGSKKGQRAIASLASRARIAGRAEALPRGKLDAEELAAAARLPNKIWVVMGTEDPVADRAAAERHLRDVSAATQATFVDVAGRFARDHINQHTDEVRPMIVRTILDSLGLEPIAGEGNP